MKTTKRFLATLLALLLGLAVLAPLAAAEEEINPNAPVITKQPIAHVSMFAGKSLNLEVAASLPPGSTGVLSYAWYNYDWKPGDETAPVTTGAKAAINIPLSVFDAGNVSTRLMFCAVVTNTYVDSNGETQTNSVKSIMMDVEVVKPFGRFFTDFFAQFQFRDTPGAFFFTALTYLVIAPFFLVFLPYYFVIFIGTLYWRS